AEGFGCGQYLNYKGKSLIVSYEPLGVEDLNWYFFSTVELSDILSMVPSAVVPLSILGGIMFVLVIIVAMSVSIRISRPLEESTEFAWNISHGKLDGQLDFSKRNDEIGALGVSLNTMAINLRRLDWLARGKAGIYESMRTDGSIEDLAFRFIRFFTTHLKAQIGAFYLADEEIKSLKLTASYAFSDRKENFNEFYIGEGLVGQAALESEAVFFSDLSEGIPLFNIGIGEEPLKYYAFIPFRNKGTLESVCVIGSSSPFTKDKRDFIAQNSEVIAIIIASIRSSDMILELLESAQTQQDALRVANEELEGQTKALTESEAELQVQQEELRVTNEELEERTKEMEMQSLAVSKKNEELELIRDQLVKKAKDLETANKYKSEFLANMSHELRTPLNSILILSQLLAKNKNKNLTDKQVESATAINASGSDLLVLINEILDLSKVEAGRVEINWDSMELSTFTADLSRVFEAQAIDKGIAFCIEIKDGVPKQIISDSHRLQQIIRNLLSNAFKFTDKGGAVTLKIERLDDNKIAFRVRDTGIGIAKDKQAAVFEAFTQADGKTTRKYGGTGLGLTISRELARLMKGDLELESELGKGTTISAVLPIDPNSLSENGNIFETQSAASFSGKAQNTLNDGEDDISYVRDDRHKLKKGDNILLIIEDDDSCSKTIIRKARERGYKCLVAENGETGLQMAFNYKPDAIMVDFFLPGITGLTALDRIKEAPELKDIPVCFMSEADDGFEAVKHGAASFLAKPLEESMLEDCLSLMSKLILGKVKRLLVVEDDKIQQESIKALFEDADFEIICAYDGRSALELISQNNFDCIILDLGLSDMSGGDILEQINNKKTCSSIPVIIYTGRDLSQEEEAGLNKYADSIIIKGARSSDRLVEEVSELFSELQKKNNEQDIALSKDAEAFRVAFEGKNILLVDDDMRNVFALSSVLEERGIEVEIAKNGIEALDKLNIMNSVDLVLMDIMMPEMDGYEATREIRKIKKFENLPILALTAKAMKGDKQKCIDAGANDYLAKPVDMDKLFSMLRVWLHE
ncbi:MAG: response regulator, partial [Spirochaetales bacterium]|nr:response regulator [Spirochaetales bacterium]